jgi:two-component system, OmpR family, response regulator
MDKAGELESAHLLVVDDDREIRDLLGRFLRRRGFRVTVACDGREMRQVLEDWQIDLIILDLMLPGEDGLSLCRRLRAESRIPVIMLTARGEDTERIIGLEIGADDYLSKPFNPHELLARIRAVLRRAGSASDRKTDSPGMVARFEGWELNVSERRLQSPDGISVELSAGEFSLLLAFIEHPQRVLSRDQLLDLSRGRATVPFDRSMDVQVGRLRRKIEINPKEPQLIKTVRGAGYVFTPSVDHA